MAFSKPAWISYGALILCGTLYFFPLFRIQPIGTAEQRAAKLRAGNGEMDVATFAQRLWDEQIPAAGKKAHDVAEILGMAATDTTAAEEKFGSHVGLGGPTLLFLRGRGKIVEVDEDACKLRIAGQSQTVLIEIGILVGNEVRDATGLVDVEKFASSQEYNELSALLNARCEEDVIARVRENLVEGATIDFVGCAAVRSAGDFDPLRVVPVQLTVVAGTMQ